MKARSDVHICLSRFEATWLMALVGGLVTNTGVGDYLAPLYDKLQACGLDDVTVKFRTDDNNDTFVMYTVSTDDNPDDDRRH